MWNRNRVAKLVKACVWQSPGLRSRPGLPLRLKASGCASASGAGVGPAPFRSFDSTSNSCCRIIETMDRPGVGLARNARGDAPGGTVRIGRVCEPRRKGRSGESPPNLALHPDCHDRRTKFGNILTLERLVAAAPETCNPRPGMVTTGAGGVVFP